MSTRPHPFLTILFFCAANAACVASSTAPPNEITRASPSHEPHSSRVRSADGVELAVTETGPSDAPAIVFIHGLGFSREVWRRQFEGPLASRFHLVAYDLRGHGQSSRPTDDVAYQDGARWGNDLDAVLTATRAKTPVVVGWSLGGLVIASYLRDHRERELAGAVFVDAVTKLAPELFSPGNARYMTGLTATDDAVRRQATRDFINVCFATPLEAKELTPLLAAAGVLPASEQIAIQHMTLQGTEEALHAFQRPALVIHGVSDALAAVAMARHTVEVIPGARLSLYENSGHAPFFDETARFDAELARFTTDAASAASRSTSLR